MLSSVLGSTSSHQLHVFNHRSKISGVRPSRIHFCKHRSSNFTVQNSHPQNADPPLFYTKNKKKPFTTPLIELRRAARERIKKLKGEPKRPIPPPTNGLLVKNLIPVAYQVFNARVTLINNLNMLMKALPVLTCKYCREIHVGPSGHPFRSCRGMRAGCRHSIHEWVKANVDDVFVPVESFHLFDRLRRRISQEERFSIPRIPALIELCIQAGVDIPEFLTKRRRKPAIRRGKNEFVDAEGEEDGDDRSGELDPYAELREPILTEISEFELVPPAGTEETALLSKETFDAWEAVRQGAARLMQKYAVRVCGYCPEVHVGRMGHKAQNCGAYKHQQRNGQHGWQKALLDDLIPPRYVWHVPERHSEFRLELKGFYGQAPAVVELCVQGGMEVPEQYKPTMRLDIGIPEDLKEADMVV